MHREFDPAAEPFDRRSNTPLYLLTAAVAGLLAADLWPLLANWLAGLGLDLPTWRTRELAGYRFALIAAVIGGARSLYTSLEGLFEGKVGADLAIAIACIAAILIGEPLVAAEVVVIGLVGECLEAVTFDRTQRALRGLAELFPRRTWVLRDGQEVRVLTAELRAGDTVVVKPGGKIPVDGVVLAGRSAVDASALTGESLPQDKGPGDAVLAGCVNQFGALTIEAKKVAKGTVAGQVIDLTAAALKDKAPLERYADRLARLFLPAVLALALLAFVVNVWFQMGPPAGDRRVGFGTAARVALYPTLAVLVVACPCPLVLATPAAVIAALGRLAGTGVLIKGGSALERLAGVTAFAFDKTGTLTEGKLELGDVIPLAGATADDVLRTAAAAERHSEHPLAKVVVEAAAARDLQPEPADGFRAFPGGGVAAAVGGSPVVVGTRRLLDEQGVAVPPEADAALARLDAAGQTALFVAKAGAVLGLIGARDRVRPEAAGVVADLRDLGIRPIVLLTGDRAAAAKAVAEQVGIADVRAELLPAEKADFFPSGGRQPPEVLTPQGADAPRSGSPAVAFVGDGVNDAPALARAAVGVAIGGTGAEVAAEAGDVVMMGDPLRPLPLLVRLSRETVRIIRQNIVWFGFGVNLVGVAVTGFLWPLFASSADWYEKAPLAGVLYHQIGSLAVLVNSMRLLAFERAADNRSLGRLRAGYRALDRRLAGVTLDDLIHEVAHRHRPIAAAAAVVAAVAWLTSGVTQVNANEVAVVQRFGAVVADLGPGLHVRWPWPVEAVTKVAPAEVRTVEIGFRVLSEEKRLLLQLARAEQERLRRPGGKPGVSDRDLTWAAAHAEGVVRVTDESVMITGDGNLVEVQATVRYTVADPRAYLFGPRDPDAVIRSAAESVLRELAAGQPFLDLLTANRSAFERQARAALDRRLAAATGGRLGVALEGLTLHDLHPPQEVVGAYHAVAEAIQRRDRLVNEAEADATRTRRRAEEEALRTVRQAEADAARKVAEATATRDAFLAWQKARSQLAPAEEAALAAELESRVRAGESRPAAAKEIDARRAKELEARRFLTDFRLTLQATVGVLAGRDKILIDADNLPGKRHLFLADPEGQKLPPWLLKPPEKEP